MQSDLSVVSSCRKKFFIREKFVRFVVENKNEKALGGSLGAFVKTSGRVLFRGAEIIVYI